MLRFATIVTTKQDDGALLAAIDQDGGKDAITPTWETIHPYGFVGIPADPDVDDEGNPTAGCQALHDWDGSRGFVLPLGDPRQGPNLPLYKKGESLQYGAAGQFIRCHDDGAISMFTTDDNTPNGRSIFLRISPTAGLEYSCPWGRMNFGPNGFHVLHSSGARLDLGAIGGIPAPLDSLASYATLEGAIASVKGAAVSLGTDAGAANAAATAALATLLTTMGAAFATMVPASGVTAVQQSAIAAALSAFSALSTNIGKVV